MASPRLRPPIHTSVSLHYTCARAGAVFFNPISIPTASVLWDEKYNFLEPTVPHEKAYLLILRGRDVLGR